MDGGILINKLYIFANFILKAHMFKLLTILSLISSYLYISRLQLLRQREGAEHFHSLTAS